MMRKSLLAAAVLPLLIFCLVYGQNVAGVIRGQVVDQSGAAVPAAEITLTNLSTGTVAKTVAAPDSGTFLFPNVSPGSYKLTASAAGFKRYSVGDIQLTVSELRDLGRLSLEVGQLAESVNVQDTAAPLQMASGEKSGLVSSAQLNQLALKGRDFFGLVSLMPGVVDTGTQSRDATSPNAIGGIYINGGRSEMKNITVDGVTSISQGSNNNTPFQPNMDTIAEVKVLTSNYQAEYGRSASGLISVVTKSGGRDLHGSGWWTHRHEQFNANNFFRNRTGLPRAPYRYDIAGFTVGGPVTIPKLFNTERNKLFFFVSQEHSRTKLDHGIRLVNMPTTAERGGDFASSLDASGRLVRITDPLSRSPFPNNVIPNNRISRLGQSILNFYPAPNYTDPDPTLVNRQNYRASASAPYPRRNDMMRIDVYPTSKITAYYRWIHDSDEQEYPFVFYNFNYASGVNRFPGKGHAAHVIFTATPRLLNDFSIGQWGGGNRWLPTEPDKVLRKVIGDIPQWFPNNLSSNIDSEAIDAQKMPNIAFGGTPVNPPSVSPTGQIHYNPGDNREITDNVSLIAGSHHIKTGIYYNYFSPRNMNGAQWNGVFNFGVNANNPNNTGHAYANALLGNYNTYTESTSGVNFHNRGTSYEFFVQDNWRVNSRLTLDFGVRFYHMNPSVDQNFSFSTFDPQAYDRTRAPRLYNPGLDATGRRVALDRTTGVTTFESLIGTYVPGSGDTANGMKVGGKDGYPWGLITYKPLSAAPRFGFAFDLSGKGQTVLRGGIGTFLDRPRNLLITANMPPIGFTPVGYYGSIDTLTQSAGAIGPSDMQVLFPARKAQLGSVTSFSMGIQHQLPFQTTIDTSYVGTVSSHLPQMRNINTVPLGSRFLPANEDPTRRGTPLPDNFFRPYAGFGSINIFEFASSANYHSLQVSAQRRFTRGLGFGVSYTYSKALGAANSWNDGVSNYFSTRAWEYGPLDFDRSQVVAINYIYELPNLGQRLRNRFVAAITDRWSVSGITSFASGAPFTPGLSTNVGADLTGSSEGARITVVGDPKLSGSEKTFYRNFRTEAFALTPRGSFGNAGVGILRGPGVNNWNVSISKNIPVGLGEQRLLRFRSEFYNAFNHTQFSGLNSSAQFDLQGRQLNANFGAFTAAREARVISFALRFQF